jgi:hypothetical protein
MFWNKLTMALSFTGIKDVTVWQDVFLSVFLIPIAIIILNRIIKWWNNARPSHLLLKGYLDKENVYIFHSQMSGADDNWQFNPHQKYITRFPDPMPSNHANLGIQKKLNIDPILSEAESECLTDVYNILGTVGKVKDIHIGDLINDWNIWSSPIFSIGFNPKTMKLMEKCDPTYFELTGSELKMKDHNISFDAMVPNDAGIVQKTFIKDTNTPVFILAGLGTMGTSASGYVLRRNFIEIGKLFGGDPFCIFLKVRIDEGKMAATIDKIYPKPKWSRIVLYPFTYYEFYNKKYFKFGR